MFARSRAPRAHTHTHRHRHTTPQLSWTIARASPGVSQDLGLFSITSVKCKSTFQPSRAPTAIKVKPKPHPLPTWSSLSCLTWTIMLAVPQTGSLCPRASVFGVHSQVTVSYPRHTQVITPVDSPSWSVLRVRTGGVTGLSGSQQSTEKS